MIATTLFACGAFLLGGACGASLAHRRWIALARAIRGQMAGTFVTGYENSRLTESECALSNFECRIDLAEITTIIKQKDLEIARLRAEIEALQILIPLSKRSDVA